MGFKIIENHRGEVERRLDEAVERALTAIGANAENYVRNNAPKDTGRLQNSITSRIDTSDNSVTIGTNVEYAPYQELGTSKIDPCNGGKGFMRPAIQDHLTEFKNIFENELQNG